MPTVLDCPAFNLDLPGARLLFRELTYIWYRLDDPEGLAAVLRTAGLDPSTLKNWDDAMSNFWFEVLQVAAKLGILRKLMYALVDQMNAPALLPVLDQLPKVDDPAVRAVATTDPNPFDARLLAQRRPFLDRDPIRTALTDLSNADGARVLVVDGPSGSGRSHIWFLVTHGCARLGLPSNAAMRVQPSAWAGNAWGPLDLMKEVAQSLDWPEPPRVDPHAQPDTHLRMLARWFRTNATNNVTAPRWLVIDDVSSVYLTEAGQRMVTAIANAAATDQAGQLRIVLLGFNGVLAAEADPYVFRESIVYLDADALKKYFQELAASVGEDLESDAIELLVSQAAGNPPYSVPLPFRRIGSGIGRIADKYLQTAGNR